MEGDLLSDIIYTESLFKADLDYLDAELLDLRQKVLFLEKYRVDLVKDWMMCHNTLKNLKELKLIQV